MPSLGPELATDRCATVTWGVHGARMVFVLEMFVHREQSLRRAETHRTSPALIFAERPGRPFQGHGWLHSREWVTLPYRTGPQTSLNSSCLVLAPPCCSQESEARVQQLKTEWQR